jgi:uncharacterized membrane protein YfcA
VKLLLGMMTAGVAATFSAFTLAGELPDSVPGILFMLFMGAFAGFAFWSRRGELSSFLADIKRRMARDSEE